MYKKRKTSDANFWAWVSMFVVVVVAASAISARLTYEPGVGSPADQQSEEASFLNKTIESCDKTVSDQDDKASCADTALEKCTGKFPSTAGQMGCIEAAKSYWSKRMETALKDLRGKISKEEADVLKVSQAKWHDYAVARAELHEKLFDSRGTMYLPWIANAEMKVVRERAMELESYAREYVSKEDTL